MTDTTAYPRPRIIQVTAGKLAHTPAEYERLLDQQRRVADDLRKKGWDVTCDSAPWDTWDGPA